MTPKQKKQIIATLMKAGRNDLANEVSQPVVTAGINKIFADFGTKFAKALWLAAEFASDYDEEVYTKDSRISGFVSSDIREKMMNLWAAAEKVAQIGGEANMLRTTDAAVSDPSLDSTLSDLSDAWSDAKLAIKRAKGWGP